MIDLSLVRKPKLFEHQIIGIKALVENPVFALFDEMGIGKTRQVIDAAQVLFTQGKINQVLVIAPGAVRSVWYDKDFGELKKYLWESIPSRIVNFHKSHLRSGDYWDFGEVDTQNSYLRWVLCNYEFIRRTERMWGVIDYLHDTKTFLALDESSCVKSPRTKQTKACLELRKHCKRVVLLNGTPISHSPRDMYSQGMIMDPNILSCPSYDAFMNRYAIKKGRGRHTKVQWIFLNELQEKFKPYVLRRLKKDCLDLPEKMNPVTLTVPLEQETWELYKKLRDEFVVWLETEPTSILKAQQAVVKALRLSQLCGGFLGGVENTQTGTTKIHEIGQEKLNLFLDWLSTRFNEDENLKLLVWCRFRAEQNRLAKVLSQKYPKVSLGRIHGGQDEEDRNRAKRLLSPDTVPFGPVIVLGSPQAGGMGLNLAAAHTVVYYSNDYNMKTRVQSEDRTHRPGQTHAVSYYDIMATGPLGQQTMDHIVIKALREKKNLAEWTTRAWLEVLK